MKTTSLPDLLAQKLEDLKSAETLIIRALPAMYEGATSPELQDALITHLDESKAQLQRLESIISDYPPAQGPEESEALAGILAEADEIIEGESEDLLNDLELIAICQRMVHHQVAGYGCARNYARRLDDTATVALLTETIDEETLTDHLLTSVAERLLEEIEEQESPIGRAV